jgi:hypothetical protein
LRSDPEVYEPCDIPHVLGDSSARTVLKAHQLIDELLQLLADLIPLAYGIAASFH